MKPKRFPADRLVAGAQIAWTGREWVVVAGKHFALTIAERLLFDDAKSFYIFLEGMFDVQIHLGTKCAAIVVQNVSRQFWDTTITPRLPVWATVHRNAPRGGAYLVYLTGLPRVVQGALAAELGGVP
jgi:hypothetical protein